MSFSEDGKMLVDKTKIFKGIAGINSYDLHPQSLLNAKRMMVEKIKTQKRKRATAIVDPIGCTGCEVCIVVCPVDCITLIESDLNFTGVSKVDQEICTGCNLCAIDCPWETISMVYTDGSLADYSKQLSKARGYI